MIPRAALVSLRIWVGSVMTAITDMRDPHRGHARCAEYRSNDGSGLRPPRSFALAGRLARGLAEDAGPTFDREAGVFPAEEQNDRTLRSWVDLRTGRPDVPADTLDAYDETEGPVWGSTRAAFEEPTFHLTFLE
jgi:hypothetical protein